MPGKRVIPSGRISDASLAKLAEELTQIELDLNYYEAEKKKIKDRMLNELERRNTHMIETNGWRITRVQAQRVITNYEALLTDLDTKQKKMVVKQVVDPKA